MSNSDNIIETDKYNVLNYNPPFSTDKNITLIHLNPRRSVNTVDSAALLSRYSRSTKSMIELMETEFTNVNRGNDFIRRVLLEYSDDSVAEMASESVGIEGLSLVAATKLTNHRIGVSFIEKSTRYVDFSPDSFYIPEKIYELSLVDEYKDLCGKSYNTFQFLFKETSSDITLDYPIKEFNFFDSKINKTVPFEHLSLESDIKLAESSYHRSVINKAFDVASYAYLLSLQTNIGLHANCRSLEYVLRNLHLSPLSELQDLGYHLYSLLDKTIHPFITRANPRNFKSENKFGVYTPNSITALYKANVLKWIKDYNYFQEGLDEEKKPENHNAKVIKKILTELATENTKIDYSDIGDRSLSINKDLLSPSVSMIHFMEEKFYIDLLCSAILFENNENLLEYDDQNINNIDNSLRIVGLDSKNVKSGILYDILNDTRKVYNFDIDTTVNKSTENTLSFNDFIAYFNETSQMGDNLHIDYNSNKTSIDKEQEYLIKRYIGERQNRRQRLGRSFEFIQYIIEVSSSAKIMRESKRHRLGSFLYPSIITARNSYDSFIFPQMVQDNKDMFDTYKDLIDDSFRLYKKIIDKSNDYNTAQYALIAGTRCNYVMNVNFRELDHYLSIRTIPQAHEEIRLVAQQIYHLLNTVHPNITKFLNFVDTKYYPLGRLEYEYNKNRKMQRLDN
ncbi:MAG TPA: FAD-dependent thymidylate synthase [Candidatus Nitrosocosmicus sp.]|nr:FAD-dependent thymidylate synthase [Candidatus Nitrosocosmicus sp.]